MGRSVHQRPDGAEEDVNGVEGQLALRMALDVELTVLLASAIFSRLKSGLVLGHDAPFRS